MRAKFTCLDILSVVKELQPLLGLRINQIYDVDSKTYLLKLDKKVVLLIESGKRIHTTQYDWPKNMAPSGFSMKLRKHLRNKRITKLQQLGFDRIIDIQFGSGEVAYHLILEIFSRGNLILTDHEMTIVALLLPHTEGERRFAVREKYPTDRATEKKLITHEQLKSILDSEINKGGMLKKILLTHIGMGMPFIEHVLLNTGIAANHKLDVALADDQLRNIVKFIAETVEQLEDPTRTTGYILTKEERDSEGKPFTRYEDFTSVIFKQFQQKSMLSFDSFNETVDEYYSQMESQKQEMKTIEQEKDAFKKVDKIKEDQASRLKDLKIRQDENRTKAELILSNSALVDEAIKIIRLGIASQMSWTEIGRRLDEAKLLGDPVASCISNLKLEVNKITMLLRDSYADSDDEVATAEVDINLDATAHVNAKTYFDSKKMASLKEKRTIDSQSKAIKSAEKKAREAVKDIKTQASISKTRKILWFEKFYWCISSENYLMIGGRDQKQNEMIVKKYMGVGDIYVHADVQGASSIVVKNPSGGAVPPKTLNEAGLMAVCYSVGWESKVLCNAWWVHSHQVSKTPPAGEYLTPGSFMIRGQKNYLLPVQLLMGFSFLFRVDDSSAFRHTEERKVRVAEELYVETVLPEEEQELAVPEIESPGPAESPDSSSEEDKEDEDVEFPDTELSLHTDIQRDDVEDVKIHPKSPARNPNQKGQPQNKKKNPPPEASEPQQQVANKIKRGQKGRQKKIKEKYKDQDEEERELRMSILKPAGAPSAEKKSKHKSKDAQAKKAAGAKPTPRVPEVIRTPRIAEGGDEAGTGEEAGEEEEKCEVTQEDLDILKVLTGQPDPEDEILYAIPVVAPYSALLSYKYKVKLTPGTARRGKAARTAADYFVRTKECLPRERDTIKSVKDDSLSRNLPGKVKLVMPQTKKK